MVDKGSKKAADEAGLPAGPVPVIPAIRHTSGSWHSADSDADHRLLAVTEMLLMPSHKWCEPADRAVRASWSGSEVKLDQVPAIPLT